MRSDKVLEGEGVITLGSVPAQAKYLDAAFPENIDALPCKESGSCQEG